ncbi:MAG TPA: GNAT family N-acetyltransferase [Chitinophagaceae bacterium]|nr:GNAT family N-acetyltransferase [Chitinophagaceae bacterium]
MYQFNEPAIRIAGEDDIPALLQLLNSAYRGEAAAKGWTSESHLISGETRTDTATLQRLIQQPNSFLLKYIDEHNHIIGCVNLQVQHEKMYLGMLSVSPQLQGGGIGKKLLFAAEDFARYNNCSGIHMTVISVRHELINWYKRYGYTDTGIRKPFHEDEVSGKHLQPLEFMVMEKNIV